MRRKHKIAIGTAALLAAAGGGVAIAASQVGSPSQESQAVIDDAAKQLGIAPAKLSNALQQALADRIDAAVAAGRLTKAEGDELKQRITSGDFPLFGVRHDFGRVGIFGRLAVAADYLGLTRDQLGSELRSGKSLAQIAEEHGKTAAGLIGAMVDAAKNGLDAAVAAGRLTRAQADDVLSDFHARITDLVNGKGLGRPLGPPPFGFRHLWRHPA